jgi:ankyrin repeat protein
MLHAAKAGNVDVLRVLLRYGADPELKDKDGMTPREAAKGKGIDIDNF